MAITLAIGSILLPGVSSEERVVKQSVQEDRLPTIVRAKIEPGEFEDERVESVARAHAVRTVVEPPARQELKDLSNDELIERLIAANPRAKQELLPEGIVRRAEIIPELLLQFREAPPESNVRAAITEVLALFSDRLGGFASSEILMALEEAVAGPASNKRAARAIGLLGNEAARSAPVLVTAVLKRNLAAPNALLRISDESAAIVSELIGLLCDQTTSLATRSAISLL